MKTQMTNSSFGSIAFRFLPGVLAATLLSNLASAQLGVEWASFTKDNSKLTATNNIGLADPEEKDYAWGDVDQDGWTDLIVVRKQPFTSTGHKRNVLLMNEGGVLVDRTTEYASASDQPGDDGFLTPTNDRDVILFHADDDGWLDMITATTLSIGTPKSVSHPRIYMNLGNDVNGDWLGFNYEADRIPQLMSNGQAASPKFCSVDAGDVTGDGFADLYFGDYDSGASTGSDLNDRLLINDGTGNFVDESTLRMTSQMLASAFGNSVAIRDFNNDGNNDILKDTSLNAPTYVAISYNDPGNVGIFNIFDDFHGNAPYHTSTGDLNNDGREDVVISDDGFDRYRYNLGVDTFGRAIWSPSKTFQFISGGDDGFASNNLMVDLNGDGWKDIIICDVDVDIGGCTRRAHIYHNPGDSAGPQPTLKEEAELIGIGGWKGVKGITAADLQGTHDVAVFDLDNDGDMDMIIGRCSGTDIWLNDMAGLPEPGTGYCDCSTTSTCSNPGAAGEGCANSTGSGAILSATGIADVNNDSVELVANGCPPGIPGLFFSAPGQSGGIPFGDGKLCVNGGVSRLEIVLTNASGTAVSTDTLSVEEGLLGGELRNYQYWYRDTSGSAPCGNGFNTTNAYSVQW
ncbi:MAG: hypothetical protein ACI8X5_002626 [Planctomycetota bacterium]|jgi:hypothetical protein